MKIDRPELRMTFTKKLRCECCGKPTLEACDAAHVFSRGAGHVDICLNLVALRRSCHASSHDGGRPYREDLIKVVAEREGVAFEDVEPVVQFCRRLPKGASEKLIRMMIAVELSKRQQEVARRELEYVGVL